MRLLAPILIAALASVCAAADTRAPLRVHDPSTIVRADGAWWVFSTGHLLQAARSTDLRQWEKLPSPLAAAPAWAREVAPGNKKDYYWAPEILRRGDRWFLYYSVSEFGKNTSAIGLATATTLDPQAPGHGWTDRGIVIRSGAASRISHSGFTKNGMSERTSAPVIVEPGARVRLEQNVFNGTTPEVFRALPPDAADAALHQNWFPRPQAR